MTEQTKTFSNKLINESSPYLLQHAHNPVNWYPWGEEALELAKKENKPILLSIGYSSCHWCHVMAHQSFENEEIASIMNSRFVNIKLDREERPDIDQIYMDAVQTMGLRGGWPLNVFLTPDQKPFYGGTYFPPEQWKKLLESVSDAYVNNYDKLYESASQFAENLQMSEVRKYGLHESYTQLTWPDLDSVIQRLSARFDYEWGGIKKAPKFPMPSIWQFLARYSYHSANEEAKNHLLFTLDKMAAGGIYDQIGGGFARYSVDGEWHVPHFEKMLYDNGQLLSLYATGYAITKKPAYREILTGIAGWLSREMKDASGGFYSALDADSEGEEGKFYVWTFDEIKSLAGSDFSMIAEYYDVQKSGNWEGVNVLRKTESDEMLAKELDLPVEDLRTIIKKFNEKALEVRNKRIRPGLDSKIISGWNGLVLTGLSQAGQATGDKSFFELARKNARFLKEGLIEDGKLYRISGQKTEGYLEDYAAVIEGFVTYYESSFDETYLKLAETLAERTIDDFYDAEDHFFYYTSSRSEQLIARKKEIFDNVIPSSNSMMAGNLLHLGTLLDREDFKSIAHQMILKTNTLIKQEIEYLANWGIASMNMLDPLAEIVVVGDEAHQVAEGINSHYLPNKVIMATKSTSELPLFQYKTAIDGKTTIYVCYNKTCRRPVFDVDSAINEIQN